MDHGVSDPRPRADYLIRGAEVLDGTGTPPRIADVAVRGDRIVAVGPAADLAKYVDPGVDSAVDPAVEPAGAGDVAGTVVIDARGLTVAPGFIDVHTHDDFAVVLHPDVAYKTRSGVTTCVVGNCGMGAAPWPEAAEMARTFHPDAVLPRWEGYAGYLDRLDREPAAVNVAALVGHGTARSAVAAGATTLSTAELAALLAVVEEGLEAGAVGLSTGLIYDPGVHASTAELVSVAERLAGTGARYATHLRNEGAGLLDGVAEAIEIGARAGVPVQLSHHKAAGRSNHGLVRDSLRLVDEARQRGQVVDLDQYPYTAGSTTLAAVVANDAFIPGSTGGLGDVVGEDVVLSSVPARPEWERRSIADLAAEWSVDDVVAARRVLEDEPLAVVVVELMAEDDVRTVLAHDGTMIGSDGLPTLGAAPHPRLYGTFPRVLARYARAEGVLGLAEAVRRMTSIPARAFGLVDRGIVAAGAFADLVMFDADRVVDRATFEDPERYPDGIRHVLVNGTFVVRDGGPTGDRPGRALRRGGS